MDGKQVPKLSPSFADLTGLRTVTYVDNLAKCETLRSLTHPLIYSPEIEDLDNSQEVITLLEKDRLHNFVFKLKDERVNSVMY